MYWYALVYRYILAYTGKYWYILVHPGVYRYTNPYKLTYILWSSFGVFDLDFSLVPAYAAVRNARKIHVLYKHRGNTSLCESLSSGLRDQNTALCHQGLCYLSMRALQANRGRWGA